LEGETRQAPAFERLGARAFGSTWGRRRAGASPAFAAEGLESAGGTTEPPASAPAGEAPARRRACVEPRLRSVGHSRSGWSSSRELPKLVTVPIASREPE